MPLALFDLSQENAFRHKTHVEIMKLDQGAVLKHSKFDGLASQYGGAAGVRSLLRKN